MYCMERVSCFFTEDEDISVLCAVILFFVNGVCVEKVSSGLLKLPPEEDDFLLPESSLLLPARFPELDEENDSRISLNVCSSDLRCVWGSGRAIFVFPCFGDERAVVWGSGRE